MKYWGGPYDGETVAVRDASAGVLRLPVKPARDSADRPVVYPLGSHERYELALGWPDGVDGAPVVRYEWRGTHRPQVSA